MRDADAVCEYCQLPAVDEYLDRRHKRRIPACEDCFVDLMAGDEMDRREQAYEDAVDRSLSEWKDEGKVGWPRPVRRLP